MYLVLYKQCILNKNYNEVIDCTSRYDADTQKYYSFFTQYLDSLTSKVIQIDDAFYTNDGSINIEMEFTNDNLQSYNYMMLSSVNSASAAAQNGTTLMYTRFCFVKNIEIRNDVAIVNYVTDIWHTYSRYIHIRKGYLSRSKELSLRDISSNTLNLSPYKIPIEYDSVNPLTISSLWKSSAATNKYNIIFELQKYKTNQQGEESKREVSYVMLQQRDGEWNATDQVWNTTYKVQFTMQEVIQALNILTIKQGGENLEGYWKYGTRPSQISRTTAFYGIGNVYVLPIEYLTDSLFDNTHDDPYNGTFDYIKIYQDNPSLLTSYTFFVMCRQLTAKKYKMNTLKSYTLLNDFTNYAIGHITGFEQIENNGLTRTIYLDCFTNEYDFQLLLSYDNKVIDITNLYNVTIPFSSIDGNENSQRKMARELGNIQSVLKMGKSIASGIGGVAEMMGGNLAQGASSVVSSVADVISDITTMYQANAPLYSSTKGTFSISTGLLNAYFGVCLFKIDTTSNSNALYVADTINETGYVTYYVGNFNTLALSMNSLTFNFIKYDYINLYGDFSQDIRQELEDILLKGVKIWYTKNV